MYKLACYAVEMPYTDIPAVMQFHAQLFRTREQVTEFCANHGLPKSSIVQLFRHELPVYVEPAPVEDPVQIPDVSTEP